MAPVQSPAHSAQIEISSVPQTMLLTLFARAKYSQMPRPAFYDAKSIEILHDINYDFSLADKDMAMSSGTVARTIVLDRMLRECLAQHPDCTVINLGCGLDTRFYRLDNGQIQWYDIDLPESMEVRRRFFTDTDRVHTIAASAMDAAWAEQIPSDGKQVYVIIEGLSMYLTANDIRQIFAIISARFSCVEVIMEIMPNIWKRKGDRVEKSVAATTARFTWSADTGAEVVPLAPGFRWTADRDILDGMAILHPQLRLLRLLPTPLRRRFTNHFAEKFTIFSKP